MGRDVGSTLETAPSWRNPPTFLEGRARQDGVDAELEIWEGMWHVWHLFARYVPEGQRAIDKIGAFTRKHLD